MTKSPHRLQFPWQVVALRTPSNRCWRHSEADMIEKIKTRNGFASEVRFQRYRTGCWRSAAVRGLLDDRWSPMPPSSAIASHARRRTGHGRAGATQGLALTDRSAGRRTAPGAFIGRRALIDEFLDDATSSTVLIADGNKRGAIGSRHGAVPCDGLPTLQWRPASNCAQADQTLRRCWEDEAMPGFAASSLAQPVRGGGSRLERLSKVFLLTSRP